MPSAGSFLGAGASSAGPSTTDEGTSFAKGGMSSSQKEGAFDVDAWHEAHNPFAQPPFQQDIVLNANGTRAVVSHGWQLDPVNLHFLVRLAPYGVLGSQMPSWAVVSWAKGCVDCHKNGGACIRLVLSGTPPVTSCQRCRVKNRTCVVSTSGFDFMVTALILTPPSGFLQDHVILVMNAELIDLYTDAILSVFTPLTGVNVASRIMSRAIIRQTLRCPFERRVDILARPGAGHQEFLERSFVPFQGAQYGDCRHRLPLPDRQSPIDATTRRGPDFRGCSAHGRLVRTTNFASLFPKRRVVVPEDFEVGDRLLDFGGFLAAGEVQQPPLHPPILPSDAELSEFPSTYHFGSEARARFEQEYQGSIAHRHADGRVTGPLVAGGFDTSEEDSAHEDDSAREDDSAGEAPPWPPARCGRVRGSLPPINEESRNMMPPSTSAAFTSVPATPSNSSQTSFASVGSAGTFGGPRFDATSFDTTPTPQASGSALVGSSVRRISALEMTPLTPSSARRVSSCGISLPPQIVTNPQVLPPPSPVRTASVGAADEVSFDEFETSEACCVNGTSVGSVESGGAVAGSSVRLEAKDVDMD
ncbi:hypothetical protein B0H14DRAFT_2580955 [Mycena olivaceomarginata]|nr:hypothetical protein B0H14DRAFT_2580955 [Mycena olivaceomarginata]